ncbi:hypothetical protein Droror1_Dr00026950 [Drosera rotundifolia]
MIHSNGPPRQRGPGPRLSIPFLSHCWRSDGKELRECICSWMGLGHDACALNDSLENEARSNCEGQDAEFVKLGESGVAVIMVVYDVLMQGFGVVAYCRSRKLMVKWRGRSLVVCEVN